MASNRKDTTMQSAAKTVKAYIDALPTDRAAVIRKVRAMIRKHLPAGYEETINWGMISYELPLSYYPKSYNKQPLMYAALAAQKNYNSLYLSCAYQAGEQNRFLREGFAKAGKTLNMGKSCIRFKKAEDLDFNTLGKLLESQPPDVLIAQYEKARKSGRC